jgi:hypothetical protein
MEINGISKISSSATLWAQAQAQSKLTVASSSTAAPQTASASLAVASDGVSSSNQIQAAVPVLKPVATQSTTVAGKSYSESVIKLGDAYVVSVPNPPGATASGASVASAESKLNMKLDTLV